MGSFLGDVSILGFWETICLSGGSRSLLLEISFRVGSEVILLRVHRAVALPQEFSAVNGCSGDTSTFTVSW